MHIVNIVFSLTLLIHIVEASSEKQHPVNLIVSHSFQGAALVEDKGHVLSSTPLDVSYESCFAEVGCSLKCVQTKGCVSFNVAVKPNSQGLYRCELLDKEKYNASTEYKTTQDFNHYNFKFPCTLSPCLNNGTCIEEKNVELSHCVCVQGMTGDRCEREIPPAPESHQEGRVEEYAIPTTGKYLIQAGGGRGGNHDSTGWLYPLVYKGGKGAIMEGVFSLRAGLVLKIVRGKRGGNAVQAYPETKTTEPAKSLGKRIYPHSGAGGGGGSFVYVDSHNLLIAAGGGGGGAYRLGGGAGQRGTGGGRAYHLRYGYWRILVYSGGIDGKAAECRYSTSVTNNPGGLGSGWRNGGCGRRTIRDGQPGKSIRYGWTGGKAGKKNSGSYGGPSPGAAGGFGGGGGGAEFQGASGSGGGYSGGAVGAGPYFSGGGGGSYCSGSSCKGVTGGNDNLDGFVTITQVG